MQRTNLEESEYGIDDDDVDNMVFMESIVIPANIRDSDDGEGQWWWW